MTVEFRLCELARSARHAQWVSAARHRQHDVEGFAPVAALGDARATAAPLICHALHRLLAFAQQATVVLHRKLAAFADVAEVRRNGRHAATAASDFDHHLGGAAHGRGLDALADRRRTFAQPAACA